MHDVEPFHGFRIQRLALEALQEATEQLLVNEFASRAPGLVILY
jgi:histone H3/H4